MTPDNCASVLSTGDAGGDFERNVGAAFLAWLLVGACIPVQTHAVCSQVHFQARRLGWKTDDLVIEAIDDAGRSHRLLIQCKRQFTVSAVDEDCVKTIQDAWSDFRSNVFDRRTDAIAIVTHLGTNRLLGDFNALLAQAKVSRDAGEFAYRVARRETLSKRSQGDLETIRTILVSQGGINDNELWSFLKILQLVSFDLGAPSGKDEASITTLLNFMRQASGTVADVPGTWEALRGLASDAAALGRSICRVDLPAQLVDAFRRVDGTEHAALRALRAHSTVILDRVSESAGLLPWQGRPDLLNRLHEKTREARVVLLVGSAGSGKSVLAKEYLRAQPVGSTFAFAAEEFRAAHIDQVLHHAQVTINWEQFATLVPGPKTYLVEGLERLLEGDARNAFRDLLQSVKRREDIWLLITCRDYHAAVIERSILRTSGVTYAQIAVPEFGDDHLTAASEAVPHLRKLLDSPALKAVLRNPFLLARASVLPAEATISMAATERGLRHQLWLQFVCDEQHRAGSLSRRRAQVLIAIALHRARSFRSFVEPPDDAAAVDALASDGILLENTRHEVAAAHDVWEDWALLEWLQQQPAGSALEIAQLAEKIGTAPALRRAYRKWLLELIETDADQAARYFGIATTAPHLSAVFVDDTLVGLLQSSTAAHLLKAFESSLLANGAALLQRILFLTRVACKTISPLAPDGKAALEMSWLVPSGRAWASLLEFLNSRWPAIPEGLRPQVLAFLEDWSSGVSIVEPYPAGAPSAGALIEKLFPSQPQSNQDDGDQSRLISVLLKIPKGAPDLVRRLSAAALQSFGPRRRPLDLPDDCDEWDDANAGVDQFRQQLLKPFDALAMCRDFPDLVQDLFLAAWFVPTEALKTEPGRFYSGLRDVPSAFGLRDQFEGRMFPPSALQGPFLYLLRYHPIVGVRFIIELVNRACTFFGEQRDPLQHVEPPVAVSFELDGESRNLWCNGRLWNAYRGTSVAPYPLICALMALEKWLLDHAAREGGPERLVPYLKLILHEANNVALLAVVASVCCAHPTSFEDIALPLLGCRPLLKLDLERGVAELQALAIGGLGVHEEIFQNERLASNKLPQRKRTLEDLARSLQFTPGRAEVERVLDGLRAAIPPSDPHSKEDQLFRLALDRMDLRRWEVKESSTDQVLVGMRDPEPDIQAMLDESAAEQESKQRIMGLYLWARRAFLQEVGAGPTLGEWKDRLLEVRKLDDEDADVDPYFAPAAAGMVVATCIRDHWSELDVDQQAWCRDCIEMCISLPPPDLPEGVDIVHGTHEGAAAGASVVALMLSRAPTDKQIRQWLVAAVLHPTLSIQKSALNSAAQLPAILPLVLNAIVVHAEAARRYSKSVPRGAARDLALPARMTLDAIADNWSIALPNFDGIDAKDWPGRVQVRQLLRVFQSPSSSAAKDGFFEALITWLGKWWSSDERRVPNAPFGDIEYACLRGIAQFILLADAARVPVVLPPLLDLIDTNPRKFARFVTPLLLAVDELEGREDSFWAAWNAMASRVISSKWIGSLDSRYCSADELISTIFFNIRWRPQLRRWARLGAHHADVDRLFQALPASGRCLVAYCRYLHDIGEDSLPRAFVLIVEKLGAQLLDALQADGNARWYLDALVARSLYEQLAEVKANPMLRSAMLHVLEALIGAGSAAAFQLRDDFVTPHGAGLA